MVKSLPGDLKKEMINNNTSMLAKKMIQSSTGLDTLKK
jgi:hypothetical protein